jgi:hypothetical protein
MSKEKSETDAARVARARQSQQEELRHKLLALHKAIVDSERIAYERIHGHMNAGAFLAVLVNGDDFSWLRPLTAWIVQLDELLDARESTDVEDGRALRAELLTLLRPDPDGDDFQRRYAALLQASPDVALAHAALTPFLRG